MDSRACFAAIGILLVTLGLAACGSLPQSTSVPASRSKTSLAASAAQSPSSDILLVSEGGYRSCKLGSIDGVSLEINNMTRRVLELRQRLEPLLSYRQARMHILVTCFNEDLMIHYGSAESPHGGSMRGTRRSPAELAMLIDSLADDYGKARVVIIGHSYGGWLSMQSTLALAGRSDVNYLASIDPISPVTCKIGQRDDCTDAPPDIIPAQKRQIRDNSDFWDNYFQTATSVLHSAPITEADRNSFVNQRHASMGDAEIVWEHAYQSLSSMLQSH